MRLCNVMPDVSVRSSYSYFLSLFVCLFFHVHFAHCFFCSPYISVLKVNYKVPFTCLHYNMLIMHN